MSFLTKQQRQMLLWVLALLLTGWAVKTWRLSRPATPAPVMSGS
jgi:hypothetical protein